MQHYYYEAIKCSIVNRHNTYSFTSNRVNPIAVATSRILEKDIVLKGYKIPAGVRFFINSFT